MPKKIAKIVEEAIMPKEPVLLISEYIYYPDSVRAKGVKTKHKKQIALINKNVGKLKNGTKVEFVKDKWILVNA
jgi:hypothetical protein